MILNPRITGGGSNITATDLAAADLTELNNISLTIAVPAITPTQSFVYARIGLKIAGLEDMIFSPLQKVTF